MKQEAGKWLKKLRTERKITLEQLSKKTGLSVGFLSQFERGLTSIAIDTLEKIAAVFNVTIDYFISPQKTQPSVTLKNYALKVSDIISSNIIIRTINNNITDKVLFPRLIEMLPLPESEPIKTYTHAGEEFVYVLEGILTLLHKNQEYTLYPGDSAHYLSTERHNWANKTNNIVKFLCVSTPNPFAK